MLIEEDPKEFVQEQDDLCGDQKSGTTRCAVAKFLESMIDNVEGLMQFVFNFVVDGVNRCMTGETDQIEDEHLQKIMEKFSLKITKKNEFIEVCLAILTIISWALPQNKGL
jgi:chemotaxis signal transduction protein